jgi:outer membrane protein OmpA-like peptidoglycan-associated protein
VARVIAAITKYRKWPVTRSTVNHNEHSKMKSIGYGSEMPIADNSTPEGKDANRRVDFILTY